MLYLKRISLESILKNESDLQKTVDVYRTYKSVKTDIEDAKVMLEETDDKDDQEMLKDEINSLTDRIPELESELKFLLIPKDPNDEKNVIVEIRGAAGGDEAAIFAGDLFRMYSRFA